jgi:hypothetical protein
MTKEHLDILKRLYVVKQRKGIQATINYLIDFAYFNFPEYREINRDKLIEEVSEHIKDVYHEAV